VKKISASRAVSSQLVLPFEHEHEAVSDGDRLRAAHRGYIYQDLLAAYSLVEALADGVDRVVVDRKIVPDDRVDDLEVVVASRRVRRQIKWSGDLGRRLLATDFTGSRSSLRIDALVRTRSAERTPADEYRLCATWSPPLDGDDLVKYLRRIDAAPTIPGTTTRIFKIDPRAAWPDGGAPAWKRLTDGGITRGEFVDFCDAFFIELEMPHASLDLSAPGTAERALIDLLSRRVGVGRYPNQDRRSSDVAALAVSMATTARSQGAELTPATIASRLRLETDFGHVSQAYPLDRSVLVARSQAHSSLVEGALAGRLQIVTGPPGAGKSWELTQVAEDLRSRGAIVARHYCYLDPSDEHVSRRITSNAFFGNLVYELTRESSELAKVSIGFAADIASLERLFTAAEALEQPLVLVVDGLDHIARVLADSGDVAPGQADIIEKLAALDIPSGVAVIVGSQPGAHLQPLREAWVDRVISQELPLWSADDLSSLARLHGVEKALQTLGLSEHEIQTTLQRLADRADGNPLYARALSVELRLGAEVGAIVSPSAWLSSRKHGKTLQDYYRHLYLEVSAGRGTADVLGVIDFAVTEHELQSIVGSIERGYVPRALRMLQPVLVEASAQGGFRVFHESFRRFIGDQIVADGRSVADVLGPVIDWLRSNGAFADARSFRFLVPALVRAVDRQQLWSLVDAAFVRSAIAAGHPREPILANIGLAAGLARRTDDFPRMVRCLELQRGALTAFDSLQGRWDEFLRGYVDVFGAPALAERLLFDGRPTLERGIGLYACTLVDRGGAVPPWREYVELEDSELSSVGSLSDRGAELEADERIGVDEFRGELRLDPDRALSSFWDAILAREQRTKPLFLREMGATAAEVLGPKVFGDSLTAMSRAGLPEDAVCALLMGAAEAARSRDEETLTRDLATKAAALADDAQMFVRCLELGAPLSVPSAHDIQPAEVAGGIGLGGFLHEAEPVREWVTAVRLHARRAGGDDATLRFERKRVTGTGWYRSWLRYVIDIATLEAAQLADVNDVVAAFHVLEIDARPFSGDPRACDLWPVRNLIEESLARGLSLLRSPESFAEVLPLLSRVARDTSSSLSREDVIPISTAMFARLLLPYVSNTSLADVALRALEDHVAAHTATHYPILACFAISVARGRATARDHAAALRAWDDAALYISAYGERKDGTVYELLEGFDVLARVAPTSARAAAPEVQDVVDAVVAHTDGKGTKQALNAFLRSLSGIASEAAGILVAHGNAESTGEAGWMTADALRHLVQTYAAAADPRLLEDVLRTIPLREYTGSTDVRDVDRRFAPICAVAAEEPDEAAAAFRVAYAVLSDDACAGASPRARSRHLAAAAGVPNVPPDINEPDDETTMSRATAAEDLAPSGAQQPVPSLGTSLPDLYRAIRTVARGETFASSRPAIWLGIVTALGTRLHKMLSDGKDDDVARVLYFFARDAGVESSSNTHPLAALADRLADRGHAQEAAMAYALAYTSTRGPWFEPFGGSKHRQMMTRAIELDPRVAREVYADQVLATISASAYPSGTSNDVLARLADLDDTATVEAAWEEMLAVIRGRAPRLRNHLWIPRISEQLLKSDWSGDEVVVALLLARVSDPRVHYKIAALGGFVNALRRRTSGVPRPLEWWLGLDVARTSRVLVLGALAEIESAPYAVTQKLVPVLRTLCASRSWSTRRLARTLLERLFIAPPAAVIAPPQAEDDERYGKADGRFLMSVGAWNALLDVTDLFPVAIDTVQRRAYAMLPDPSARRERAELMHGMRLDAYPPTPTILWEREKLFEALDDTLSTFMVDVQDDATGPDPAILEGSLAFDLAFHLGYAASRCRRPAWPSPSEMVVRLAEDLTIVGSDDPAFEGWTRLGYVELECSLPEGDDSFGGPDRTVSAYAGVVTEPGDYVIPEDVYPFCDASTVSLGGGPLVGIEMPDDWLCGWWRLRPPVVFVHERRLRDSAAGEPLRWYDDLGRVAIAIRTWRVVRGDPEAEPATFTGCDLVARPDVILELETMYGALRELGRKRTEAVAKRS
jgi:hypothetical protein